MVESAKLLGADEETAKQEMKKALEFEIKLANATTAREFRRDPNNLYNPTTLDQFENLPGKTLLSNNWSILKEDEIMLEFSLCYILSHNYQKATFNLQDIHPQ